MDSVPFLVRRKPIRADLIAASQVPKANRAIGTSGQESLAVRGKDKGKQDLVLEDQDSARPPKILRRAGLTVLVDVEYSSAGAVGADQSLAIRSQGQTGGVAHSPVERGQGRPGLGVPELHLAMAEPRTGQTLAI